MLPQRSSITKQFVLECLIENAHKALGRMPIRMGNADDPKEVFVYRGDVANRAIQLMGAELAMFIDRKEIKHLTEFDDMSDEELVLELSKEAQKLLEHTSDKDEDK